MKEKGERRMRRMMVVLLAFLTLMGLTMGMAAAERGPIVPMSMKP
jgi:cell division protein FtsB